MDIYTTACEYGVILSLHQMGPRNQTQSSAFTPSALSC